MPKGIAPGSGCKIAVVACLLVLSWFVSPFLVSAEPSCHVVPELEGAWSTEGEQLQLRFEPGRIIVRDELGLRAATILHKEPCRLTVRDQGFRVVWSVAAAEAGLRMKLGKREPPILLRLEKIPEDLDIDPLHLPSPVPVSPEVAKEIAAELSARAVRDQEALKLPDAQEKRPPILEENRRYLRSIVERYGWIDIPRFGRPAANAAIFIAKHAADVRLLLAAQDTVERDARENGGGKELVAVLVDELRILTGHKQKYGSQIVDDEQGKPLVVPVEDLTKVEEYRAALGIPAWKAYLSRVSEVLYQGEPVRLPAADD